MQVTSEGTTLSNSHAYTRCRSIAAQWPSSLQDTDNEPAMARALSLVLSKCGLARSGGLKEPLTPAAAAEAAASALLSADIDAEGETFISSLVVVEVRLCEAFTYRGQQF